MLRRLLRLPIIICLLPHSRLPKITENQTAISPRAATQLGLRLAHQRPSVERPRPKARKRGALWALCDRPADAQADQRPSVRTRRYAPRVAARRGRAQRTARGSRRRLRTQRGAALKNNMSLRVFAASAAPRCALRRRRLAVGPFFPASKKLREKNGPAY